jgi:hypothetical protein
VVFLATSKIYVQNLIPFGKFFHEFTLRSQHAAAQLGASKIGQAHRTNHEKF